jgi:UDP-N-acetylglucosamine:LPS N-acetylglucosamine transferase
MGELAGERPVEYRRGGDYHVFHDVIRRAKAIVSKPGGCTLIDSLDAGTPVVLLEPYGYAERSNARIWEHLGFGIAYDAWRETGFDEGVLERLHANIVGRAHAGTDYPGAYAERLARGIVA